MSENKIFAKVVDGIVTDVACAGSFEWIQANPDRYGDVSLWHDAHFQTEGKKYAGIGDRYDAELDEFVTPSVEPTE
jgi:hypothetical protein